MSIFSSRSDKPTCSVAPGKRTEGPSEGPLVESSCSVFREPFAVSRTGRRDESWENRGRESGFRLVWFRQTVEVIHIEADIAVLPKGVIEAVPAAARFSS